MNLLRTTTLAIVATLLLAGTAQAAEVSMAGGAITFDTPANWMPIMQTEGDTEAQVFQVPDPSPTGKSSLARVSVTVTQARDISSFHQFMAQATAKALALPGYQQDKVPPVPNSNLYTAQENGTDFSYTEHYWFKHGYAIQLRCVRPTRTQAGSAWQADFDKGCDALAVQLK